MNLIRDAKGTPFDPTEGAFLDPNRSFEARKERSLVIRHEYRLPKTIITCLSPASLHCRKPRMHPDFLRRLNESHTCKFSGVQPVGASFFGQKWKEEHVNAADVPSLLVSLVLLYTRPLFEVPQLNLMIHTNGQSKAPETTRSPHTTIGQAKGIITARIPQGENN